MPIDEDDEALMGMTTMVLEIQPMDKTVKRVGIPAVVVMK